LIIITLIFKHTRIDCLCQLSLIVAFYVDRQLQVLFVKLRNTFSSRLSNVSFVLLFQCKTLNDEVEIIGLSVKNKIHFNENQLLASKLAFSMIKWIQNSYFINNKKSIQIQDTSSTHFWFPFVWQGYMVEQRWEVIHILWCHRQANNLHFII
jgi:hypothetical protein